MRRLRALLPPDLQAVDPKMVTHRYCLEIIRTPSMELERLIFLANYLTEANWNEVCEERACEQICGWPLCGNSTSHMASKPRIVMKADSQNNVQLLDRTELYWYCSQDHMELSKQLGASLNAESWWNQSSRTPPLDLNWLFVTLALYEEDESPPSTSISVSTEVKELSKGISDLENFTIKEHLEEKELTQDLLTTTIQLPQTPSNIVQSAESLLSLGLTIAEPRPETPSVGNGMAMDVDNSSRDSFSDDDDEDGDAINNFFNSSFSKAQIPISLPPNLQVLNAMLHWVTWKSQKFACIPNYDPLQHSVSLHVRSQHGDYPNNGEMDTSNPDEEPGRHLPPVDGVDVERSRRQAIDSFISMRLATIRSYVPEIDQFGVKRTLDMLLSTFDVTSPMEPLKTAQWSTVTVSLLYAISPQHPGLAQILESNRSLLEQQCAVDFNLVKEIQGMFIHHG